MIRSFFLLVIFVIGLAAAALWQGQMHHLRRVLPSVVPVNLPEWSDQISDAARLRAGEMDIDAGPLRPKMKLRWKAVAPNGEGLRWAIFLTGQGVALEADLLVPFWPDRILLRNGRGTVALTELGQGAGIDGMVQVDRLTGRMDHLGKTPGISGLLSATLQRVAVDGVGLGEGPLRLEMAETGEVSGTLALRGGGTAIDGLLSGARGVALGQLDVTVADVTRLPAAARGALERLGDVEGTILRLQLPVPLQYGR